MIIMIFNGDYNGFIADGETPPRHFRRRDADGTPLAQAGRTAPQLPSLQLPAGAEKIAIIEDKPKEIKLLDDELLVVGPTPFAHPCKARGGDVVGQPMPCVVRKEIVGFQSIEK